MINIYFAYPFESIDCTFQADLVQFNLHHNKGQWRPYAYSAAFEDEGVWRWIVARMKL